jgi:hypothetical protein
MKLPGDDEEIDSKGDKKEDDGMKSEDGLDSRWNSRMKEKLDRAKSKVLRDMSITVSQRASAAQRGSQETRQRRMQFSNEDNKVNIKGSGRVREELTSQQGTIVFLTGDLDGEVDICVQSISASAKTPSRFSLNVTMAMTTAEDENERQKSERLDANGVKSQIGKLERDMRTLSNRVQTILSNADFNKDQEVAFHNQSIEMHKASKFWPAIRLMVLFITTFTQVNNITRYLRNHHIGL